jgi:hypothetical protein
MRQVKRPRTQRPNTGRTLTDEVWPWSHLVPFFLKDIRGRVGGRAGAGWGAFVCVCGLGCGLCVRPMACGCEEPPRHPSTDPPCLRQPPQPPQLAAAKASAAETKAAGGEGRWIALATESGRTYYYNKIRNVTRWADGTWITSSARAAGGRMGD